MAAVSYDYTYTNPAKGYSYVGQVVADPNIPAYNYIQGQTYAAPNGGSYVIGTAPGIPTSAPAGSVYQTAYADATGVYDSSHYDPKNAAYYDIRSGYDRLTGNYTPSGLAPVPAWSGIGLGNEYSYVNTGTAANPNYQTFGGGGTAPASHNPGTLTAYDYQFLYPDGSYYDGKVVDNGTYGYAVGQSGTKGPATYAIYAVDPQTPAPTAKAGWDYAQLYHDGASGTNYPPSDIVPATPFYQQPTGYGGIGSLRDYIQKPGGYYVFSDAGPVTATTPAVAAIPLPT